MTLRSGTAYADQRIAAAIAARTVTDPDYWAFSKNTGRTGAHSLFQYPAMMVPKMQGELIDIIRDVVPNARRIWDPFVGSGTILVESMLRGLDFTGCDINPLAILTCMTKAATYSADELDDQLKLVKANISSDRSRLYEVAFNGRAKWFSPSATIQLSRIRRAIELVQNQTIRRLFWVVMAETIRRTSNSRTSTFKLHVKQLEDLTGAPQALPTFLHLSQECVLLLKEHERLMNSAKQKHGTNFQPSTTLTIEDVRFFPTPKGKQKFDLVVTSPPYGDNLSTVPYGQFSFLPLQWIPHEDFPEELNPSIFKSTHGLDTASLGGSKVAAMERGEAIAALSRTFASVFNEVRKINDSNAKKLGAFCYDFCEGVISISEATADDGISIWTVGNRRISGVEIPFAKIIEDIIDAVGGRMITSFKRRIPSKRMALRNDTSCTMRQETVLIARMNVANKHAYY